MRLKPALFALPLSLLLLAPHASFADTLTLTGTSGGSVDGVDIYPYDFTITSPGGDRKDVALSCLNFNREVYIGETWSAEAVDVSSIGSAGLDGESQKAYIEDAWLFNQYAGASAQQTADIQFAIWDIMDSAVAFDHLSGYDANAAKLDAEALAAYNSGNFSFDANDIAYVPTDWSYYDGQPQIFMADPTPPTPTPEPSSLLLFGTGLLGMGFVLRNRLLKTQTTA